jgi:putative glycosyltransferase (TIGR04372 family)
VRKITRNKIRVLSRVIACYLENPKVLRSQGRKFKEIYEVVERELIARDYSTSQETSGIEFEKSFNVTEMQNSYFRGYQNAKGNSVANRVRIFGCGITNSIGHTSKHISMRVKMAMVNDLSMPPCIIFLGKSQNSNYVRYWSKYFPLLELDQIFINSLEKIAWRYLEPAWIIESPSANKKYSSEYNRQGKLRLARKEHEYYSKEFYKKFKGKVELELLDPELEAGHKFLEQHGCYLSRGDFFVTFHVRSQAQASPKGDKISEYARNADISTYIPAINWIIAQGGFVVRVGEPNVSPLPKIPGLIDYSQIKFQSESLNTFFLGAPRYMVGTQSGPIFVPSTFGIRTLQTNTTIGRNPWFPNSLIIPKLSQRNTGEILTVAESVEQGNAWRDDWASSDGQISWRNNSEDEILSGVQEIHNTPILDLSTNQKSYEKMIKSYGSDTSGVITNSFFEANEKYLK